MTNNFRGPRSDQSSQTLLTFVTPGTQTYMLPLHAVYYGHMTG